MTTFSDDLSISTTNNEGFVQRIKLTQTVEGVKGPFDLTGLTFLSSVKKFRSINAEALADITVDVIGDPTEGVVELSIPVTTMEGLKPHSWFYDFNTKSPGQDPDCLWIAPFVVEAGVSKWE